VAPDLDARRVVQRSPIAATPTVMPTKIYFAAENLTLRSRKSGRPRSGEVSVPSR
jgi:hypothetical protein